MGSNAPPNRATLLPLNLHRIDPHLLDGPVLGAARDLGNLLHHLIALDHFAENAVLVVEPGRGGNGDKELAAVGAGAGIGHGEQAVPGMIEVLMKFVGEFVAGAAAAGAFGVAALDHEIRNDAVEDGAIVERLAGLGSLGERDEVLYSEWSLVGEKLDLEASFSGVECGVDFVGHP